MPLPTGNPDWPPAAVQPALKLYQRYGAWYSGDVEELSKVYASTLGTGGTIDPKALVRPAQYAGGLIGLAARSFWGTPPPGGSLKLAKLHVPLASDIAMTSADLLFAEPPTLTFDEDAAGQERLDEIIESAGLLPVLIEAAEMCAAYGDVYLRAGWDPEVADHVLVDAIPADAAIPEFRSGRLSGVTFWREVAREAGKVYRHLERHEPGRILHALYQGTDDKLGKQIALQDHPETEPFAALVGAAGYVETGAEGLAVEHFPNMRPHRVLRGSHLGRSDYAGIEGLFDALDETWTSWLRDIRIGKGRIVVPDIYLTSAGRGRGAVFDAEQEVFQAVNALPGADSGLALQVVQFGIRVVEHQTTATEITGQAVRGAGYSVQTFGEAGEVAVTATEVVAKQQRTMQTRSRKIGYWSPRLRRFARTMLQIDRTQFKSGDAAATELPDLEWPDAVADGPQAMAQTLQMLKAAEVISRETGVAMLHPDWDETAVKAEVDKIKGDVEPPMLDVPGEGPGGFPPAGGPPGKPGGKPGAKPGGKPGAKPGAGPTTKPTGSSSAGSPRRG